MCEKPFRVPAAASALACIVGLATGCTQTAPPGAEPVRPVKTQVISAGDELRVRTLSGKVEASRRVELAFQVPGVITQVPIKEGQRVAKGELIAKLRQDEFQARLTALQGQLDQARAELQALRAGERTEQRLRLESQVRAALTKLNNARLEFDRAATLIRTNAIARRDFDAAETAYRVAQEEHKAATQQLEKGMIARDEDIEAQEARVRGLEGQVVEANIQLGDATLTAPFDGVIAQRFVEPNQNIQARAPVVKFQDVDEVEVIVDVPETVMAADLRTADIVQLSARFSAAPDVEFPVQIREVSQRADPTTQTFRVRTVMKSPTEIRLLPGMTATVTLSYRRSSLLGSRILVPVAALFKEPTGEQVVWVIDQNQTVVRRPVKTGTVVSGQMEIVEGLQPGDRIAVAGATRLRAGMKVRDLGAALGGQSS